MKELVDVNDGGKNNEVFGQAGGLVTPEDWARYSDKLFAGRKGSEQDLGAKPGPSGYLDLPSPFDYSDDKIRMGKKDMELKGPKCVDLNGSHSDTDSDSSQGSHSQEYLDEQLGNGPVKDGMKKVIEGGLKDGIENDFFDADRSRSVKPDIFPGPTFDPDKPDIELDGGPKTPLASPEVELAPETIYNISDMGDTFAINNNTVRATARPAPILTQPFTVNRDGSISRGTTRSAPLGK
ncbi:MAG: hypothetical protein IPM23_12845 [Candidatus Melainabacteria bacterium]|nr:hypothetical protein [Candidatus Melainabacteria bacterium]